MRFLFTTMVALVMSSVGFAADPAELTAELNAYRVSAGLPPLSTDPNLCVTCQSWATHLASTGRFYHGGGEHVIAMGHTSARDVIAGWLASPGHRAWLLSANATCGWGVAAGRDGRLYWAGAFGGGFGPANVTATQTVRTVQRERGFFRFRQRGTFQETVQIPTTPLPMPKKDEPKGPPPKAEPKPLTGNFAAPVCVGGQCSTTTRVRILERVRLR